MNRHRVLDPKMGRVAYWNYSGRNRPSVLYEGLPGFGRRILARVDPAGNGKWTGAYMHDAWTEFPDRETALQAMSARVFRELDLEVRTRSRIVVERPGGIVDIP